MARAVSGGAFAAVLLLAGSAHATATTVLPGDQLTLAADLVLADSDSFVAGDATGERCQIHGGGFSIKTADPWSGTFTIINCDVDGLGIAGGQAINLTANGASVITIRGSTFSASAQLMFTVFGATSIAFQNNTIQADSLVPAVMSFPASQPAFFATGFATGPKLFQGNKVFKSTIAFLATDKWLIGGDTTAEGNVLVGTRTGIDIGNSNDMIVRNNYSHTYAIHDWNQVKNVVFEGGTGNLLEHNVLRGHNWQVQVGAEVEVRYNVLMDNTERGSLLASTTSGGKIHHNLILSTTENVWKWDGSLVGLEGAAGVTPNLEFYNNTVNLGGVCNPAANGAVMLVGKAVMASVRSNVFMGIRLLPGFSRGFVWAREPQPDEETPPIRLGYADYNLFFNPDSTEKTSYAVGIAGKTPRIDPGFGFHDIPAGGAANMQVNPGFTQIPHVFPFVEDEVLNGTTTTCQILSYYRQVYSPPDGSPLIDAGDPADGAGNDIGAIDAAQTSGKDRFAGLCDTADIGHPTLTAATYKCTPVPIGGTNDGPLAAPGWTCICTAGAAPPDAWTIALGAVALGLAVSRRRRRSRH